MSKLFSLIRDKDIYPDSDTKLIPADQFSLLLEAKEIVEQTKTDRERVMQETKLLCEEERRKAEEAGFQKGLDRWNLKLLELDEKKKELRHEIDQLVLNLSLEIAKKIVGEELASRPETIVNIVMKSISQMTQNRNFVIYVNKSDKELLQKNQSELLSKLSQVSVLVIEEREDITPGGCIIETESGIVNITLENQWKSIEKAFSLYLKQKSGSSKAMIP